MMKKFLILTALSLSAAAFAAPADDEKLQEYNKAFRTKKSMELVRKMADLPADTKNKLTVICHAAVQLPDSEEAIRFLKSLNVEKADEKKVNSALVRIYYNSSDAVKASRRNKNPDRTKFNLMLDNMMALPADTPSRMYYIARLVNQIHDADFALSVLEKLDPETLSAGDRKELQNGIMQACVAKGLEAVKNCDQASYTAVLKKLEAMPADHPRRQQNIFSLLQQKPEFGLAQAERLKLDDAQKYNLLMLAANEAAKRSDRKMFDQYFAELGKGPAELTLVHQIRLADKLDGDKPMQFLSAVEKRTDLTDGVRFALYDKIRSLHHMDVAPYGFAKPENYAVNKACLEKQLELAQKNDKLPYKEKDRSILSAGALIQRNLTPVFAFGDYAFGEKLLGIWHSAVGDGNVPCAIARLKNALRKKDAAAAEAVLTGIAGNPKVKTSDIYRLRGLAYFATHSDCAGFDKFVCGDTVPALKDRYLLLSWISAEAFRANRHDICETILKEIRGNMFKPVTRLTFAVPYEKDCPQTADAWTKTETYKDWSKLETRFKVYADMYEDSHHVNITRHLKDAPEAAYPEENKAGLAFAFDDRAFHIYVRVSDPAIAEVRDGQRKGPSFEMLFRPGNDCAYYTNYLLDTPSTENTFPQDWQRPGLDYTLMHDFIQRDIVMTDDSMAVHWAIPFKAFYNRLPVGGRTWTFGLQVWGKTNLTISGAVHELSRMGILDIKFTPEQEMTIRRLVLKALFNDAARLIAKQGEYPYLWSDNVLGDPDFFAAEVKPVFDELAAAQKMEVPDKEFDAFYQKYAHTAAKLKDIIAEKRAAYLRKGLLQD